MREHWKHEEYRMAFFNGMDGINPPQHNWTFLRVLGWVAGKQCAEDCEFFASLPDAYSQHELNYELDQAVEQEGIAV